MLAYQCSWLVDSVKDLCSSWKALLSVGVHQQVIGSPKCRKMKAYSMFHDMVVKSNVYWFQCQYCRPSVSESSEGNTIFCGSGLCVELLEPWVSFL